MTTTKQNNLHRVMTRPSGLMNQPNFNVVDFRSKFKFGLVEFRGIVALIKTEVAVTLPELNFLQKKKKKKTSCNMIFISLLCMVTKLSPPKIIVMMPSIILLDCRIKKMIYPLRLYNSKRIARSRRKKSVSVTFSMTGIKSARTLSVQHIVA